MSEIGVIDRDLAIDLIACCGRMSQNAGQAATLRGLIRRNVDWTRVPSLAQLHAVVPLVHLHLGQNPAIPNFVRQQLAALARANAQANLFLMSRLIERLRILEREGVPAIPFKGPLLAVQLYGGLAFRQYGDLDIFVRQDDVLKARRALVAAGDEPFSTGQEALYFRYECELELAGAHDVHIELHWNVVPKRFAVHVDIDGMWSRVQHVQFAGMRIATPSPEDLILLLSVHGAKHSWRRMAWVCDIGQLVDSNRDLDWNEVWSRATTAGVARMVRLALLLAADLVGTELPAVVEDVIRADAVATALSFQIRERYHVDRGEPERSLRRARFHIAARERLRDQFRYALNVAVLPCASDWGLIPLNPRLAFMYSFLRPVRLVVKHAAHLNRTFCENDQR